MTQDSHNSTYEDPQFNIALFAQDPMPPGEGDPPPDGGGEGDPPPDGGGEGTPPPNGGGN